MIEISYEIKTKKTWTNSKFERVTCNGYTNEYQQNNLSHITVTQQI